MQLGLRLHDAEDLPIEALLPVVKKKGYTCAHLALSKAMKEFPCGPSALTPGYAHYLKRVFDKNEMDIAVLGNYLNLAHPDPVVIEQSLEKYYAHIRFASLLGCGMVGTETGAPNAEYKYCPECRTDKALLTFIKNIKPVVRCAEQYGVILALEIVARHIVYNPKRMRMVLDEIGSHNLQVLFDPVNLLDLDNVDHREEVIAEGIELLGPDIAMVHFKDFVRVSEGYGLKAVGAGTGEMDYTSIMKFIKKEKPFIYATLENTTSENAEYCGKTMKELYERA
ncbi:sugar phosphate isomerase/epimerase family protein [Anaerobium acetethylicum]|uniref:Sugar phosphate isomerase/epimerase n=1 Tax=Anaerobium acetethylicum TaxID=1619234 RepID=A0A1D3TX61_9FIRM|nr:sugar phosphate isomerase/epimerase family protein [Anaerobium acetethylicum]SCP98898.1 Sugar phosphate isomerase/epimerase [Anaerobium acetethylicum]